MEQYHSIKRQNPDCLLFFRLGDFYELFLEDAKIAARVLDIVLTRRHKNTAEEIPMCGVPFHASDTYIARLIKEGFRVAVCEQMEKAGPKGTKGVLRREVVRIITPGTLTEDTLLNARAHNFLMALYPHQDHISLACVDISTGDFFIESHPITALPSVLNRISPQEIVIPEASVQMDGIQCIWHEWKSKINPINLSRFDRGEDRLTSFFNIKTMESFGSFSDNEIAAAGALLDYVLVTQKKNALMISRPKKMETSHFLEIDGFTRCNLEIATTLSGEKKGSLLETIDLTVTPMGARLFGLRLANPLKNLSMILERLESVKFFITHEAQRNFLRQSLKAMPDMDRALSRLFLGRGTPKDLGYIRTGLQIFPQIEHMLLPLQPSLGKELSEFFTYFQKHQDLCDHLNKALMPELPLHLRDGLVFARGYDAILDDARDNHKNFEHLIQELQEKYIADTGIANLRIKCNAIIGYYIEVSAAAASKIPFHFTLKQSLVSTYRYVTPELLAMDSQRAASTQAAYIREGVLFEALVERLRTMGDDLRESMKGIAVYDVSAALAELAFEQSYTLPVLNCSKNFIIEGGRHPVIERTMNVPFIKNDCCLNETQPIWLITGANMAGKSTFLRQNALIALLAHIGSFVPADTAEIGIMDRIFSRVGASDDLAKGRSTFMVEMIETATILNKATAHSLVILDEVGRGTSTYDGLALASACIEHIAESLSCRTLFATHYHEISSLNHSEKIGFYTPKIKEWDKKIIFFYKIIPGLADGSYGIHVAQLAGLPPGVIHRAEAILQTLTETFQQKLR
jgi:DNA mismatch repair protein MutS